MNEFAQLSILATQRRADLGAEADRSRIAPSIRRRNPIRVRRRRITVEIYLSGEFAQQVDEVFASLARHLGEPG
jgi:hypothetical protein